MPLSDDAGHTALRVFADTCVLFAAIHGQGRAAGLVPPGASLTVFQLGQARVIDLVVSAQVLTEARPVLLAKLATAVPLLDCSVALSTMPAVEPSPQMVGDAQACVGDAADAPIMAAAAASHCRFLVTLNRRHFPEAYQDVAVVEPGELVAIVRRSLLGLQRL